LAGRRLFRVAAAALLLIAGRPPAAFAHAVLLRTDPPDICAPQAMPRLAADDPRCLTGAVLASPPAAVRLLFTEPVSPVGRGIRVVGSDGRRVDRGPARVDGPELTVEIAAEDAGTYFVTWRVISADTHPARGSFAFSVGHASFSPAVAEGAGGGPIRSSVDLALQALARGLHFAGYALGFGTWGFLTAVLRPLGLDRSEAGRRVWRVMGVGVVLLLIAEPLALLAQTASLGVSDVVDPEATSAALESSFGRVLAQRLGAALLLWVLLGVAHDGSARATLAIGVLGLAVAFVDGEAAHAAGVRPAWLGLGVNTLHVAAMGAWTGGLAVLLRVWRLPSLAGRLPEVAARTGRASAAALAVLVATGTVMAIQHLAAPADMLASAYGRTLGVKVALLCVALGLAAAAVRTSPALRARWWNREAAVLAGVLGLAGLLVSLPPPK
jgi:copper transport protein